MLEGKRIAILAERDFEDAELTEPLRAMKAAGARVIVVGSGSQRTYTSGAVSIDSSICAIRSISAATRFTPAHCVSKGTSGLRRRSYQE